MQYDLIKDYKLNFAFDQEIAEMPQNFTEDRRTQSDNVTGLSSHHPKIEMVPISALRRYAQNARLHTRKQIRQIERSFKRFGFITPVVIDANSNVVCGHGRLEAAQNLGMDAVPALRVEHLTKAELRAYRIADNKIAQNAEWDTDLLRIELNGLAELDVDFDLELTGFDAGEIDILLDADEPAEAEVVQEPDSSSPATSRLGDLWHIGPHRLLCSDSLSPDSWPILMAGDRAQMVYTDPPYNVRINGHVSGLGKARHEEFAMASGDMTAAEFTDFLRTAFELLVAHSSDAAIHFIFMDWRHMREVLVAAVRKDRASAW